MDKRWSKWVASVCLFMAAGLLILAAGNYVIDPYDVFGSKFLRPGVTVNDRYGKIEHLIANPDRYVGVIVGSSVMGVFDPRAIEPDHSEHRFYNLSFFGGTPEETLQNLVALRAQGIIFRKVIMGIDAFAFLEGAEPVDLSRRPHPAISGEHRIQFFLSYLVAPSFKASLGKLAHAGQKHPSLSFDFLETGLYRLPSYEQEIEADPSAFTRKHVSGPQENSVRPVRMKRIDPLKIDGFTRLANWLDSQGIACHYFINPMTRAMRAEVGDENLTEIVHKVSAISKAPVPDYSSSIERKYGDGAFYDLKHVRPRIASEILAELFK